MKKIAIIALLISNFLFGHNEYYKIVESGNNKFLDFNPASLNEALRWEDYSGLRVNNNFSFSNIPIYLLQTNIMARFIDALDEWENSVDRVNFTYNTSDGIQAFFTEEIKYFTDPVNTTAQTTSCAASSMFVASCTETEAQINDPILAGNPKITQSRVVFNNTSSFGYVWSTDTNVEEDEVSFQYIVVHEFGHILGLHHCSLTPSVMYADISLGNGNSITSNDLDGLENLLDQPLGIEDYILISIHNHIFNINQTYVGCNEATFIDVVDPIDPSPDYITQWNSWKIKAFNGCDQITLFEYSSSGYINIPSLPAGYNWDRDEEGNVIAIISVSGLDNDGILHNSSSEIKIGNVPNTFITQGTLSYNTYWCGNLTMTGTITVPSGKVLTIAPGSVISFPSTGSLVVQGTLLAEGASLKSISGSWGPIIFDGATSSNSLIVGCGFQNNLEIRCLNSADIEIKNSLMMNNTHGIYIYNSQPNIINNNIIDPIGNGIYGEANGKSPLIQGNVIKKINVGLYSYQGIYLNNYTSPYITGNDIQGFASGIYYGGGGHSWFTDNLGATPIRNNRLTNNGIGLVTAWGSSVTAGLPVSENPGSNNSIYNNSSYDLRAYQSGSINAAYNWWGNDGLQYNTATGGTISYADLYLTEDPWENIPLRPENSESKENENISGAGSNSILEGLLLERIGNVGEIVSHYKQMIKQNSFPEFALGRLATLKRKYRLGNIQNYFENIAAGNNNYKPVLINLLASMYLDNDNYQETLNLYDFIIQQFPNTYHALNAKFAKFFAALNYEKNYNLASELLTELQSLSLSDEDFLIRLRDAEYLFSNSIDNNKRLNKSNPNLQYNFSFPKEYSLLGNYPNPFNPSTTIAYNIPVISNIELKIYDILGNEIRSFNLNSQSAGKQNILWDGKNNFGYNVSSGIYIYKFKAIPLEGNFKVFEASSKLIMMK